MTQAQPMSDGGFYLYESYETVVTSPSIVSIHDEKQTEQMLSGVDTFITKFIHPPSCSNYLTSQPICSGNSRIFSILEHFALPTENIFVIDILFYNQFKSQFLRLSETQKWGILPVDMRIAGSMDEILDIDFVLVDSPLNWYLDAIDIKKIILQAEIKKAVVLVGSNALELYNLRLTQC